MVEKMRCTIEKVYQNVTKENIFVILWDNGFYESEGHKNDNPLNAVWFTSEEKAKTYLEKSYPINSTWRGQWIKNKFVIFI